jgi:VanZ family protein
MTTGERPERKDRRRVPGRSTLYAVLSAVYFVAVVGLHRNVSQFVTYPRNLLLATIRPRNLAGPLALILCFAVLVYLVRISISGKRRTVTLAFWLLLLLAAAVIHKYLLVHPIEIAHYPQYAIGALLVAKALDPGGREFRFIEAVSIASLIGVFDEFYQFFVTAPVNCRYMDWMDMWLNLIGAGMGGLLIYGFKDYRNRDHDINYPFVKKTLALIAFVSALFVVLNAAGILHFHTTKRIPPGGIVRADSVQIFLEREPGVYGSWQKTFRTGYFYVPGPEAGIFGIFALSIVLLFYPPGVFRSLTDKVKSIFGIRGHP